MLLLKKAEPQRSEWLCTICPLLIRRSKLFDFGPGRFEHMSTNPQKFILRQFSAVALSQDIWQLRPSVPVWGQRIHPSTDTCQERRLSRDPVCAAVLSILRITFRSLILTPKECSMTERQTCKQKQQRDITDTTLEARTLQGKRRKRHQHLCDIHRRKHLIWVLKDEEAVVDGLEGHGMPGSAMGERERER